MLMYFTCEKNHLFILINIWIFEINIFYRYSRYLVYIFCMIIFIIPISIYVPIVSLYIYIYIEMIMQIFSLNHYFLFKFYMENSQMSNL